VVIPVYNEGPNIERVLRDVARYGPPSREVLVVYDFDEDDTLPVVRRLQAELPDVRPLRNAFGRGVLNAMRTGIEAARGRFVLITMADASDDLADLGRMVALAEDGAAIVAASRYMPGGAQLGGPFLKGTMSRAAGLSLRHIGGLPIHDATSSFKLYAKSFLDSVRIESKAGFELALELCVKAHRRGLPLAEVPTVWRDRTAGTSRFAMRRWLPHYLRWYVSGIVWGVARRIRSVLPVRREGAAR
jgi:dolichol-phosphate mannosyltransferase